MPRTRSPVPLAVVIVCFMLTAGCGETYDLRGPGRAKGDRIRTGMRTDLTNGNITITTAEGTAHGRYDRSTKTAETLTVETVEAGSVTSYLQYITLDRATERYLINGESSTDEQRSALEGRTVRHHRSNGQWRRELVTRGLFSDATEAERLEVENLVSTLGDEEMYPDGNVPVGHQWTVEGPVLRRVLNMDAALVNGSASMTFEKVIESGNDKQAEIRFSMDVTMRLNRAGEELAMQIGGTGVTHRSLTQGLDRRSSGSFQMVIERIIPEGNGRTHVRISGPATMEEEVQLQSSSTGVQVPTAPLFRLFAPVFARNTPLIGRLGRILLLALPVAALASLKWIFGRRRQPAPSTTTEGNQTG